ncbi:MAG: DUF3108 domain-containing protein [Pseudomonadota bacterium]
MMNLRKALLALLIVSGVSTGSVDARAEPLESTKLYLVMSMAGVTAGSLQLKIDPADGEVSSSLKMKSQGLFKLLTGYKSFAEARTRPASNGDGPKPVSYDSTYETKSSERKVQIRYDPADGGITDLGSWKRGKPRKSKVPEELRVDTVDPLTGVLQVRHWITELRGGRTGVTNIAVEEASASRTFEIFDGRRRYRLNAELLERLQIDVDGEDRPAFRFKVQMEPLAGFSSKDMLANWASEGGKRWIELVITDEDNPLPVSMTTKGGTLKTTVYLRKVCIGESRCLKIDN